MHLKKRGEETTGYIVQYTILPMQCSSCHKKKKKTNSTVQAYQKIKIKKYWSRIPDLFSSLSYSDRFLESTNCVGMCTNLCKIPCQRFIQDSLGTAVYMSPSKFFPHLRLVLSMETITRSRE